MMHYFLIGVATAANKRDNSMKALYAIVNFWYKSSMQGAIDEPS
jgi:hypothetical protein